MSTDQEESPDSPTPEMSDSEEGSLDPAQEQIHELLGELRAEVTRLKAHRAKARAENWIQRHPMLAVALAAGIGGAAGYGVGLATRPQPPSLSEQARRRLRGLAGEARRVAGDVGRDLTTRAARSGEQVRERAQKTGRRLADEAQAAGEKATREAQGWASRVGQETGEALRQAAAEAVRRAREGKETAADEALELSETLVEQVGDAAGEQAEAVQEAISEADSSPGLRRTLFAIAGLAAGSYLAAVIRRWL